MLLKTVYRPVLDNWYTEKQHERVECIFPCQSCSRTAQWCVLGGGGALIAASVAATIS